MGLNIQRGIVIGSGMAGLLAARALAPHCDTVMVLEKDAMPESPAPRPGVPQGHHIHVMLAGGVFALDRLFPGAVDKLVRAGAQCFDYGESRFHSLGDWMPRVRTGLPTLAMTRPFIEHHVRQWVASLANVRLRYGGSVAEPVFDGRRVTGVLLTTGEVIDAGLVIDATGRHSRLPAWLVANGFPAVPCTEVGFDLGYATGHFRVPTAVLPDHPMLYVVGHAPRYTRVGVIVQLENGLVYGGMGGYQGDHPPGDPEGFLGFAKSLVHPEVYRVLAQSELLGPIVRFRIPNAVRRHFSSMRRFPAAILPAGDCICSYDPAFGHGMAAAALQAEALDQCLGAHGGATAALARDYLRRVDAIVDVPWDLCCGENLKYSGTTGPRPLLFPVTRRLKDRLATRRDPAILRDFYSVVTLAARPRTLLQPRILRTLLGRRRG
jgi:2-polyprenyl-6-methoxyphenol hydroxylase-like FAD-dependent oxidoreductase